MLVPAHTRMPQRRERRRWRCERPLLVALVGVVLAAAPVAAQEPQASLTMNEVIDLFHRPAMQRNPQRAVDDFIRFNKIAFLPTRAVRRYLRENGVPDVALDALKHNFAGRIRYRVCAFEPLQADGRQFAALVSRSLESRRIQLKTTTSLLADKSFEPVLCEPSGLGAEELAEPQNKHIGFVLVMGELERGVPQSGRATITARLVFQSRVQGRQSFTMPFSLAVEDTRAGWEDAAGRIAEWSIRAVEEEVEGAVAAPAGP